MTDDDRAGALCGWLKVMSEEDRPAFLQWFTRLNPSLKDAVLAQQPIEFEKSERVVESLDEEVAGPDGETVPLVELLSPLCDRNEFKVIPLTRRERMEIRDVVANLPRDECELAKVVMRHGRSYARAVLRWPESYYHYRLARLRQVCFDRGLDRWPSETRPKPFRR